MNKITIFTVEITDNHYLDNPICQLCINSWDKLKNKIIEQGYDCEIKIFKTNDPEVIQFKKEYPMTDFCIKNNKLTRLSNAFRFYILSKYENYIWLDSDIYIKPNISFYPSYWIDSVSWPILSNINNKNDFKTVWNYYLNSSVVEKDCIVHENIFGIKDLGSCPIKWYSYIHLTTLMKSSIIIYVKNTDKVIAYIKENWDKIPNNRIVLVSDYNLRSIKEWVRKCNKTQTYLHCLTIDNCTDTVLWTTLKNYAENPIFKIQIVNLE